MTNVSNPKILHIDDSVTDRLIVFEVLSENGFNVIQLEESENCIETIIEEMPQLVLLDVTMPRVSGNDALKIIRNSYSAIELPVIMLTGRDEVATIVESLQIGANDYINKPFNFDIVIKRIQTQLIISSLSKKAAEAKELNAINAMVTTYNHEINNPLTIAFAKLANIKKSLSNSNNEDLLGLENSLNRLVEITKKTKLVLEKGSIEYEKYANFKNQISL